jgi:hypothetical protein
VPVSLIGSFCAAAQVLGEDVDIQTLVGVRSLRASDEETNIVDSTAKVSRPRRR